MSANTFELTRASVIEDLESSISARQVAAIDDTLSLVREVADLAVRALEVSPDRYLIFERLFMLGPSVIVPLKTLCLDTRSGEARVLASVVLLNFGLRDVVETLLDAVRTDKILACLAAHALAKHGILEAEQAILARLNDCAPDEHDLVVCLVDSLEQLGRPLPDELLDRLTVGWPSWKAQNLRRNQA